MRFPKRFVRYVGGKNPQLELGQEPAPDGVDYAARDNVLVTRQFNASGWPVQRVACGWYYEGDGDRSLLERAELKLEAYVLDHESGVWFKTAREFLPPRTFAQLDMPTLIDMPIASGQIQGPDPIEVAIVPSFSDDQVLPPGKYTFVMGSDCSSTP